MLKYENEINDLLSTLHAEWMDEEDKVEFNEELFKQLGLTREQFNSDLEIGVINGYPVEVQIELSRNIFQNK